ncbi:uncharacterized protein LOC111048758 [Nilaparvata lugens]|uniref:uncharacterized protein LOC111048758 n=1 Tax=Nilaparvata lugens TaxID=108931 RepID=UPI00193D81CD|nr:uncharacterized protein LOC111048758 [Nilaparvata lugens]
MSSDIPPRKLTVYKLLPIRLSTASGIPDFRSPGSGLYSNLEKYNLPYPEAIFDLSYFHENPKPFLTLAQELYPGAKYVPNIGHYFVKLLENKKKLLRVFTQNIDGLERLAGVSDEYLVEAHGSFVTASCTKCKRQVDGQLVKQQIMNNEIPECVSCRNLVKPDIVFFGEQLPERYMELSMNDPFLADFLIVIGTSLQVYPFAGLADMVPSNVTRLLINRETVGSFGMRDNDLVLNGDITGISLLIRETESTKKSLNSSEVTSTGVWDLAALLALPFLIYVYRVKLVSLSDALSHGLNIGYIQNVATQLLCNEPVNNEHLNIQSRPLESIAEVVDEISSYPIHPEEINFRHHFLANKNGRKNVSCVVKKTAKVPPSSTVTSFSALPGSSTTLTEAYQNAICDTDTDVDCDGVNETSVAEISDNPYTSESEIGFVNTKPVNGNNRVIKIESCSGTSGIVTSDEHVSESSSPLIGVSESNNSDSSVQSCTDKARRKGGWPKGRKRKPELYEHRPPKAPSTGYVFYLNEKRKLLKNVPFSEVTKLLGNEWSRLGLEEKRAYLQSAEDDKKRYQKELRLYRKTEAYQSYRRKRLNSICFPANGTEESDVDATDELDEEDNEELYCRVCNQWFVTMHNKREHLHGTKHFQNISLFEANLQGRMSSSFDESSLDGAPLSKSRKVTTNETTTMADAIAKVYQLHSDREKEVAYLKQRMTEQTNQKLELIRIMQHLKAEEERLKIKLDSQNRVREETEDRISKLYVILNYMCMIVS